jgi:hypothetical protein
MVFMFTSVCINEKGSWFKSNAVPATVSLVDFFSMIVIKLLTTVLLRMGR